MTREPDAERRARESRALQLVDSVLDLAPADRRHALEQRVGDDAALRAAALELLQDCEGAERDAGVFGSSAGVFAAPMIEALTASERDARAETLEALRRELSSRYEVIRELGRGGSATVFLAHDHKHQSQVAIKVIRGGPDDTAQRSRFQQEIVLSAQLRHPYVVPLLDSGNVNGVPYYVMPYVAGESLRQRIDAKGALALDEVVAITRDVAEALDFAHKSGVVHRDIKPQNILLSEGHALVVDFGIALALDQSIAARLTDSGLAVGTPLYMAPEQAAAQNEVGSRADIYSLGCVVYEMLTGEPPFGGTSARAVIAKHAAAPPPNVSVVRSWANPALDQAVRRALAKRPADRYATASEFHRALEVASTTEGRVRTARPNRWLVGALGIVCLLAIALKLWSGRTTPGMAPPAGPDPKHIAVLYFDALASDRFVANLASGLTEDLIDALAQVRGLHVISPNGVVPFREGGVPMDSIARILRVGTIVGGSVSASEDVVRATVRLIDPTSGRQLQSRSFEAPRTRSLSLRDRVADQVALFLRERIGEEVSLGQAMAQTRSLAAWQTWQNAQEIARQGNTASRAGRDRDAIDLLLRADSLHAAAERLDRRWIAPVLSRGGLALTLALMSPDALERAIPGSRTPGRDRQQTASVRLYHQAIDHAKRALQRDARSPGAFAIRGMAQQRLAMLERYGNRDSLFRRAEADLRSALDERQDDARSWYTVGELYFAEGRMAEARQALAQAYEHDAFLDESRAVVSLAFFASLEVGVPDEAKRWCDLGRSRYSDDPRFATCELIHLGWIGSSGSDVARAWRLLDRLEGQDTQGVFASQRNFLLLQIAATAARAGMRDSARAILQRVRQMSRDERTEPFLDAEATIELLLGDRKTAIDLLREAIRRNPEVRLAIANSPRFGPLRGDSSFIAVTTSPPAVRHADQRR